MDRSEYYYDVVCNNQPCQDLNKQFDCNTRTPTTRYFFNLNSGYAQGLYSNVKVYQPNSNEFNKEIKNNPLNIINQK